MNPSQIIRGLMATLNEGDMAQADRMLTDDFQIVGPFPRPMKKAEWLKIHSVMKKAFPDWTFHIEKVEQHGSITTAQYHITGTHRGPLDLTPMGMGVIPATEKAISLPPERADFTFDGEQAAGMQVHASEGGGLPGLLRQIGVETPG